MATWIVGGIVALIVGAVIAQMIKDKRRGKRVVTCGGDCSKCRGCH